MRFNALVLAVLILVSVPEAYGLDIDQVGVFDFGVAYDIVYWDDVAYVSGNDGVDVFDVSDRGDPVRLTRIDTNEGAFGLALVEETLYVAAISDGLLLVDVNEPDDPVILGSLTEIMAVDVFVDGGYAYVSSRESYSIVDVSDPRTPVIVSTVSGTGRSDHIYVSGDTLYLGEANRGLMVYDISNKSEPRYVRTVVGTVGIFDIEADGDMMYLACHGYGVKVLDISDRLTPRVIGGFNNGGEAYGVHIVDDYLLVADLQQGVEILKISIPTTPTISARWTNTHPHEISGDSQYVYLADQDHGLEIFMYGEGLEESDRDSIVDRVPFNASFVIIGALVVLFIYRKNAGAS